jgi:hypothetical protein
MENAIVTAQARGGYQAHQLFRLGGQHTFQIRVVVDVIETLHQKIVGLVNVDVEPRACLDEPSSDLALLGNILFGEQVGRFFAFGSEALHRRRNFIRSGGHRQMVAEANWRGRQQIPRLLSIFPAIAL